MLLWFESNHRPSGMLSREMFWSLYLSLNVGFLADRIY